MSVSQREEKSILERHVQTILLSVITASLLFLAKYIFDDNASRAEQRADLVAMKRSVDNVEQEIKRLTSTYVRREEFIDHEVRIRQHQERISELQTRLRSSPR